LKETSELTVRGIVIGAAITFIFTAANVYLGLKVGLTFATSIPAAVISMAILRKVRDAGILENNIVQTVASSAGTLSSIIFVLPGLIMIGWWTDFPYWTTFGICAAGGVLGVMFSIPLRRALVVQSSLPFPEGVAAAEVLKVGTETRGGAQDAKAGFAVIVVSTLVSAAHTALIGAKLLSGELATYFRVGSSATGIAGGLSFALLGAGHLVGLSVGTAMFCGFVIAWGVATPVLTALHPADGSAMDVARTVWAKQVRFIGAGAIGVAALWKLLELVGPIWRGMAAARASRAQVGMTVREDQDIPANVIGLITLISLGPITLLLWRFLAGGPLAASTLGFVLVSLIYIVIVGAFVASVCGYMAGLIGSSNSPLSGVGILAILGAALLLTPFAASATDETRQALIAFALFVTSIIFAGATISNDNLQDLKTGQLVGATPWRQQVALMFGVAAGAAVIPPILDLLNKAYGFAGAVRPEGLTTDPLPAPQATLISSLARGVLGGDLDWSLLAIGGAVGVGLLLVDAVLARKGWLRIPPLAVGIGIYLPMTITVPVFVGAVLGWLYDRRADRAVNPAAVKQMGVLMASGMIVGESIFGVLLAGLIVGTGNDAPLALVGDSFAGAAEVLGPIVYAALAWALYRVASKRAL
jgi:putative OPT family oligopeptide transporter